MAHISVSTDNRELPACRLFSMAARASILSVRPSRVSLAAPRSFLLRLFLRNSVSPSGSPPSRFRTCFEIVAGSLNYLRLPTGKRLSCPLSYSQRSLSRCSCTRTRCSTSFSRYLLFSPLPFLGDQPRYLDFCFWERSVLPSLLPPLESLRLSNGTALGCSDAACDLV